MPDLSYVMIGSTLSFLTFPCLVQKCSPFPDWSFVLLGSLFRFLTWSLFNLEDHHDARFFLCYNQQHALFLFGSLFCFLTDNLSCYVQQFNLLLDLSFILFDSSPRFNDWSFVYLTIYLFLDLMTLFQETS